MYHVVTKTTDRCRYVFSFRDECQARNVYHRATATVVEGKLVETALLRDHETILRCSAPEPFDAIAPLSLLDELRAICLRALNEPLAPQELLEAGLGDWPDTIEPSWGPEAQS